MELFRKALEQNIIAVMDTGSGKTLVAVMLIKEMMERELEAQRPKAERKMCFFIVNNVPLVFQQAEVIRSNSTASVIQMYGGTKTNKFSQEVWDEAYEKADVVVSTAQILLDLLRHGMIKISKVHLLIFDECHHARKDHPFCCIMKEFYHSAPKEERPKVFGMTASPSMDAGSKLYHSAKELEQLMDCKVFTVDLGQMDKFVERPKEVIIQYHSSRDYGSTALTLRLKKHCSMATKLESVFESTTHNLKHLGPWCVNRLWQLYVERFAEGHKITPVSPEIKIAYQIVKSSQIPPPVCSEVYLSPKVLKLIQLLRVAVHSLQEEFCGIIFVQRRDTAMALCLVLQELEELQDILRVQVLTGHSDESERVMRMSFRDQTAIITQFRNKDLNLLVATNVAEEGLDIQPCNFVVRFDPATTTIGYIQSRGRARKKNSRYIMMHEIDNRSEEANYERLKYSETTMRDWCRNLDGDRLMQNPLDLDDDDDPVDKLASQQVYRVPSTGAIITLDSAIPLIHYYCSTLAGDEFTSMRPHFNIMPNGYSGFFCDLTLPPNAPIRVVHSDFASTKFMAKKSAAFKACEKLHAFGALNDNLLPIMSEAARKDDVEEASTVEIKDKNKAYPMATPKFWTPMSMIAGRPIRLFGTIVELTAEDLERLGGKDRYRSICLLTFRPLPCQIIPFHLYIEGNARTVTMKSSSSFVYMDDTRLRMLHQFTLNLFQRMCRKTFECPLEEIPYFVAPLIKNFDIHRTIDTLIAWDDVELGQSLDTQPSPGIDVDERDLLNCIVGLRNDNGRDFFVKRVMREYRRDDPMPQHLYGKEVKAWDEAITQGKSEALGNGGRTFGAYFKWKHKYDCAEDELVLSVDRVRKMRNHLQPAVSGEEKRDDSVTMVVPLGCCVLGSIHADVLRMSQLIPSVLYSLDSTLLVQEVRENVGLMNTELDLMQVALTSTSANRDYQYERLELLGDSFLKFSSTIRLYIVNPSKDEGQLHSSRIRIISNTALLQHATRLELFKYICTTPFHRTSWRPTRFIVGGKPWEETQFHNLSNKMLADVVEASLGAAYLSGGATNGFHAAKVLGIPFGEFSTWDDFERVYSEAKAVREKEEGKTKTPLTYTQLTTIRDAEKLLGYRFKDPYLFVEAMTHASHIRNDPICYQRLEFLGDAVLDFQVVRHYYEKYYDAPPGAITLVKDASVNNQVLGAISIEWGLHKFLSHYSPALFSAIARTIVLVDDKRERSPNKTLGHEYWNDLTMPKVLGDLVESTLGAVFVDSGFDVQVVTDLFMRMIKPFLDKYVDLSCIALHPNKVLIEMLQSKGCNEHKFETENCSTPANPTRVLYRFGLRPRQQEQMESENMTKCHFKIHGRIMATASGEHVEEVRKQVAISTLRQLNDDPGLFESLCVCPKRRGNRQLSVLERYRQESLI
ncbi:Dicer-like protein 1 [Mortierella sp. GBA43]|nr:Dicer-like protein 1 [Mortierella sp. GBA43]